MLFTRLHRSARNDSGTAPSATVIETIDTSAPSWRSDRSHCALRWGNIETTTCRST
jgi:hypothetical protein